MAVADPLSYPSRFADVRSRRRLRSVLGASQSLRHAYRGSVVCEHSHAVHSCMTAEDDPAAALSRSELDTFGRRLVSQVAQPVLHAALEASPASFELLQ